MAPTKLDSLYNLLASVDKTYSKLPINLRLEVEKISQGLTEFGPRKLRRSGSGTEFFESRAYRPDVDDPRKINARLSARAGKPVVVEKEAEIRQHFYLWRDATPSMDWGSDQKKFSKKQAAEVMLLAFAKHLAKNEELIGILDGHGTYRGGKAPESLAHQMVDVSILTGSMPQVGRKLPMYSTVVMFSDFLMDRDDIIKGMGQLTGLGLRGYMVMVLDPQELEFEYKGHVEFEGLEGEGKQKFERAEAMKNEYQHKIHDHIEWVEELCRSKGFTLILQRTDQPLHEGLMSIYGLSGKDPVKSVARRPVMAP